MSGRDPRDDEHERFSTPFDIEPHSSETSTGARPESEQLLPGKRKLKKRTRSRSRDDKSSSRRLQRSHARVDHSMGERPPTQAGATQNTQQVSSLAETHLSRSPVEKQQIARQNNPVENEQQITNRYVDESPKPKPTARQSPQATPNSRPQSSQPPQQPPQGRSREQRVPQQQVSADDDVVTKTFYLVPACCIKYPRTCYCFYGIALLFGFLVFVVFSVLVAVWGAQAQNSLDANDNITVSRQEVSILKPINYGRLYSSICLKWAENSEMIYFGKADCQDISYQNLSLPPIKGPRHVINVTENTVQYSQLLFYWQHKTHFKLHLNASSSSSVTFHILQDLGSRNSLDDACRNLIMDPEKNIEGHIEKFTHSLPTIPIDLDFPDIAIECPGFSSSDASFECSIQYKTPSNADTHYSLCFVYETSQTIQYELNILQGKMLNLSSISLENRTDCYSSPDGCCLPYKGNIFEELATPTCMIIHTNNSEPDFEESYNIEITRRPVRPDFSLIVAVIGLALVICLIPTVWYKTVKRKVGNPALEGCNDVHCKFYFGSCFKVRLQIRQYPLHEEYRPLA